MPWQRGHPVQGGKGSLRHMPNIKLIGQQAAKLWGFFANNAISRRDLDLWPLYLEIDPRGAGVPGTLPTKFGIRRLFRLPFRWRHGTDRQTDGQDQHMMGLPSRKDGSIIIHCWPCWNVYVKNASVLTFAASAPSGIMSITCWSGREALPSDYTPSNSPVVSHNFNNTILSSHIYSFDFEIVICA